jgi:hypothetical protein
MRIVINLGNFVINRFLPSSDQPITIPIPIDIGKGEGVTVTPSMTLGEN